MNKLYTRIEWENFPSEKTALNESNLNRMDLALDNMDNRVIEMDSTKVNKEVANKLVKTWSIDESTGIITVVHLDGSKDIFDLNIEKIPVDFKLSEDGILTMTTDDGTQFTANIGAMIPVLIFEDSDTIVVSVEGTGVNKTYSFSIKAGSVTEDKLQPNFLADVKTEVAKAQASQAAASQSASEANASATVAEKSETNARASEIAASESASAASDSEKNAGSYAEGAASSAQSASNSAGSALEYSNSANGSADTASAKAAEASESATGALESAQSASLSAESAGESAASASDSAILAESYTHGGTGAREGEDADNAKYYMEMAKAVASVDIATKDQAGISKPGDGLDINPDGTMSVIEKIRIHPGETINSEEGVHGLREWEGKLEYFDGENWVEIKTGGSGIGVGDVIGASITATSRQTTLKWTDPDDIEVSGVTIATWAGTKLVRKEGSAPESIADGVVVVDNTEKNKYSSEGYTDTGLENGTTYYYRFFPYTTDGVVTAGTSLNATPERIVIATVPSQSGTLTYNGSAKTPSWSNYDSSKMTIGGTTSATNAGAYTATFTPKEDYMWSDGSIAAKSVTWKINKTSGSVALSSTSVELNLTYTSKTVTVSGATGMVTVSSNNTSVATASISGNTITINSVNSTSGSATITVSVASSTNYNATSKTISVTASFTMDGETATPINDVQTWLKCDSTGRALQQGSDITTLAEVIANSDILGYLMSDESAMQYLERSTGFAEEGCASETFMTALGASSWVDETILNSDLWFNKCIESQYFDKVFKDVRTIHAGAYETITMSFTNRTITTNSDGNVNFPIPNGTYTFTGSVSGQSFTRTVTSDTTDIYVMPGGSLYWYGNECTEKTGGLSYGDLTYSSWVYHGSSYSDKAYLASNKIMIPELTSGYRDFNGLSSKKMININGFSKLNANIKCSNDNNVCIILTYENDMNNTTRTVMQGNNTVSKDIVTKDIDSYLFIGKFGVDSIKGTDEVYAVWLE